MIKLLAIAVLCALAWALIYYRTNEQVQRAVIMGLIGSVVVYVAGIVVMELLRS